LDGFPLKDVEKDFMLDLVKKILSLYFTEILGFCLMGNHFHLLVKMFPEDQITDEDLQKRFEKFYGDSRSFAGQIPYLREKLSSLSEFMREIKVGFARYYNRRHQRRGYFWGDRFKSVIVDRFRYRTRYFTDSGIIGSKEFVSSKYQRFKHLFHSKHEKKPKPIKGLGGIYSLKRLSEVI
jgi:REP element-mobilizing transposase RayT